MAQGAGVIALKLHREGKIHGVLDIGGSCGTALGSGVMRHLPIGVPKFVISSQAGNPAVVSSAVKTSDICMFHSVSDVAGLNPLTKTTFARACGGVVGMARAQVKHDQSEPRAVGFCTKDTAETADRMMRRFKEVVALFGLNFILRHKNVILLLPPGASNKDPVRDLPGR